MKRQRWQRRGLLATAPLESPFAETHAALPTPAVAPDGWDLYVAARDAAGRSQVARLPLEQSNADLRVGQPPDRPALGLGALGAFDDSGVTPSCVVDQGDRRLLYYTGWSRGVSVPFYFYVGLAASEDSGHTFKRVSRGPILERNDVDPFLTASPSVLVEGDTWRMWYVSATEWSIVDGEPRQRYHIRYAESPDGVRWQRDGRVCIDYRDDREYAIGRPCVMRDRDRYRMWMCARGDSYRLAYAESDDGLSWERDDAAAELIGAPGDWEREMEAYPYVFETAAGLALVYNGNGYGRSGVGWATLEGGEG